LENTRLLAIFTRSRMTTSMRLWAMDSSEMSVLSPFLSGRTVASVGTPVWTMGYCDSGRTTCPLPLTKIDSDTS
jgi:hypothetical protein